MARDAGAKEGVPGQRCAAVRYPYAYGIDMPTSRNWWPTTVWTRKCVPDRCRCPDLPGPRALKAAMHGPILSIAKLHVLLLRWRVRDGRHLRWRHCAHAAGTSQDGCEEGDSTSRLTLPNAESRAESPLPFYPIAFPMSQTFHAPAETGWHVDNPGRAPGPAAQRRRALRSAVPDQQALLSPTAKPPRTTLPIRPMAIPIRARPTLRRLPSTAPAAMEGAEAAIATASGMSAGAADGHGPAQDRRPCDLSQSMFGSTIKLMGTDMARFGIETTFVPQTDAEARRAAVRPTRACCLPKRRPTR